MGLLRGHRVGRIKGARVGGRRAALTIVGYYGFGNLGDEALRLVLEERLGGAGFSRLLVLVPRPERPGEVNRAHPLSVFCAMRRSSAVVFGGGGLLQNASSRRSLAYYLSLVLLAQIARRPVHLLGQGIGPIRGRLARRATRGALRRARRVGCRDRGSLSFVESLGLTGVLDGDLLFLLPPLAEAGPDARRASPHIVLALKGTGTGTRRLVLEGAELLRELHAKTGASFTLLVSFPKEDFPLARALAAQAEVPCRLVAPRTADEASEELRSADLLIAARLHALEIGLRAGVPLLALAGEGKIADFVKEVAAATGLEIPCSSTLSQDAVLAAMEQTPGRSALLAAYRMLHERTARAFAAAVASLQGDAGEDL